MSLNKAKLETDLEALFDKTRTSEGSEVDAKKAFVRELAGIIDAYVKSAKVTYTGGLTAPNGPVAGTFNHTIS